MDFPSLGHYKDAKQGGKLLLTPDGCGFRRQRAPQGNKCHYLCHIGTKYICKVTHAVQIDTNMVVRMPGSMIMTLISQLKEKEGIGVAVRNLVVYYNL